MERVGIASASSGTGTVDIVWDDDTTSGFHHLWLRDNCPCDDCCLYAIDEHRVFTALLDFDVRPEAVVVDGVHLCIDWSDGHRSRYRGDWLADRDYANGRYAARPVPPIEPVLWDAQGASEITRFAFADLTAPSSAALEAMRRLRDVGAVVVREVPADALVELVECFAPLRVFGREVVHEVSVRGDDAYNISHTDQALPPHTDYPSYHAPPSVQFLHMVVNESVGGESVIVDGWNIIEQLRATDDAAIELLASTAVPWREFSAHYETYSKAPLIERDGYGEPRRLRFSNQLLQPLDLAPHLIEDWYRAYQAFGRLAIDPANQVSFRLDAGDALVVHSRRVMHGRKAFQATGLRRLRDAYTEMDDVRGQIALLERRLVNAPDRDERR